METGKSPVVDGIPIELYKEFLETIKYNVRNTFHEALLEN